MFQIVAVARHDAADRMRRRISRWQPGRCNAYTVTLHLGGFVTDQDAQQVAEGLRDEVIWSIEKYE